MVILKTMKVATAEKNFKFVLTDEDFSLEVGSPDVGAKVTKDSLILLERRCPDCELNYNPQEFSLYSAFVEGYYFKYDPHRTLKNHWIILKTERNSTFGISDLYFGLKAMRVHHPTIFISKKRHLFALLLMKQMLKQDWLKTDFDAEIKDKGIILQRFMKNYATFRKVLYYSITHNIFKNIPSIINYFPLFIDFLRMHSTQKLYVGDPYRMEKEIEKLTSEGWKNLIKSNKGDYIYPIGIYKSKLWDDKILLVLPRGLVYTSGIDYRDFEILVRYAIGFDKLSRILKTKRDYNYFIPTKNFYKFITPCPSLKRVENVFFKTYNPSDTKINLKKYKGIENATKRVWNMENKWWEVDEIAL